MTDIVTASLKATVRNPTSGVQSGELQVAANAHGQLQTSDIHGKWFEANFRNKVFKFNVTAVTVPVVASGLVSVFTLYNPPGSNVVAEIIEAQVGVVLATTVVNDVGWYSSSVALTALGTFTTIAQARAGQMQSPAANAVKPYSAYTHSGTPIREDIIATFGATTAAQLVVARKTYEGELLLPAGIAASIAMSTAAGTTSGLGVSATWAEWPTV